MNRSELFSMLELLEQPAFLTCGGCVLQGNAAFRAFGIPEGTPVHHFLCSDRALMASASPESYPCSIGGAAYTVRLLALSDCELCVLYPTEASVPAQALANTALSLRRSLQQIYSAAELLDENYGAEGADAPAFSSLLQGVFRVERIADNLEYLHRLRSGSYVLKCNSIELCSFFRETLEKAEELLRESGIRLEWSIPDGRMPASVDRKLLSLAFWNLLANAAATRGECIRAEIERRNADSLLIKVTDPGNDRRILETPNLLRSYAEQPRPGEPERGVGIGLSLICAVCELHSGSFLLTEDENGGHTAVMQIALNLRGGGGLHESVILPGERSLDDGLVGLAEVLPRSAYRAEDIFG